MMIKIGNILYGARLDRFITPPNYSGLVIFRCRVKTWYQNGKAHRLDGPAIICSDGYKAWQKNGKFHREDGPAVIRPDGTKEWYWKGDCFGSSKSGFSQKDLETWKRKHG